jgi:hypothetical protein
LRIRDRMSQAAGGIRRDSRCCGIRLKDRHRPAIARPAISLAADPRSTPAPTCQTDISSSRAHTVRRR